MKLASLAGGGVVAVEQDDLVDLSKPLAEATGGTLSLTSLIAYVSSNGLSWLASLAERGERRPLAGARLDAPIPRPGAVVAAPVNYVDHMSEMSEVRDIRSLGVFLKASSSVIGHGSTVRLPYSDRRFDHEGELGVVIASELAQVDESAALDGVFGYTCLLDITMRGGEDRSTRKSFRSFTPIGPSIVTAGELGDPGNLKLTCSVNGAVRQQASTSDLIWSVARLIAYVPSVMTLFPGDVIATGTPSGVGPIKDGDELNVTIERIGSLRVSVSSSGAIACPTLGAGAGPVPPPPPNDLPL